MKPAALYKATEIISAVFILLFVYTATSKLLSHQAFVITITKSPLIGFAGNFLSWLVPITELLIATLLLIPRYRTQGLVASLGIMTMFTIYIAYMLLTSSHLPCSCGGIISKLSWNQHLWLNVFLTFLAATGLYINNRLNFLLQ